ncbi:DUF4402 domain-containing protein [Algoriphagus aquatilis]|uniref:DUF4402 domain-containing protein n=1 Tax=Algoriphagus aquatilis TaxID=490186 RepID=A0ABW0BTR5_9BACT
MKTIFKSVLALGLVAGMTFAANAQKTTTAPASARILADLTITLDGVQDEIAFGNVSANTPAAVVLDANGTDNANTGTVTNVARFNLTGADASITVYYDATVTLTETVGGVETIVMTPEVVGDADDANQGSAAGIANAGTVALVSNAFYIWVGGTLPTMVNKAQGTYSGTFEISVEYN